MIRVEDIVDYLMYYNLVSSNNVCLSVSDLCLSSGAAMCVMCVKLVLFTIATGAIQQYHRMQVLHTAYLMRFTVKKSIKE